MTERAGPGRACPCRLGRGEPVPYEACCGPAHRGEEPATAEALMRSRYSAFVLGEAAYLWRTLHPEHRDRLRGDRAAFEGAIRKGMKGRVYRGLRILEVPPLAPDGSARVLFLAEVFIRGKDLSFVELSTFLRAPSGEGAGEGGWRYFVGELIPRAALPIPPERLDAATFERLL